MNAWAKRLDTATNVAILCAFLLVGAVAAKRLWEPSRALPRGPSIGSKVSLQGVDWSKSKRTLVLVLSTGCHFCSESANFYERLVSLANSNGTRVLAVLPQPIPDSHSYLEGLGVTVAEVMQSPLSAASVSGTPTVLLVDGRGRIRGAWVGKLGPEQEQQVVAGLHSLPGNPSAIN